MKGIFKHGAALSAFACATVIAGAANAQEQASAPTDLVSAIQAGTPTFELRTRYETAQVAGLADAEAFTLRTRLGWKTAKWNNLVGEIEFDDVRQIGGGDYNDGVPPAEPFATIADPDVTELNRLQLTWTPTANLGFTLGRQRIVFDDQRFIGAVGWRQDDQTFDAARADFKAGKFTATYAYLDNINRIFAEELDWESQSHLVNASYAFAPALKLTGFAYMLDFENAAAQSSETYGVRAAGRTAFSGVTLNYAATYATQEDYGDNPADFELDYVGADIAATYGIFTAKLIYEELEGNGARGFSTPLATLHAFQGWADVFLATPAAGLTDTAAALTLKPKFSAPYLSNIALTAAWHDFETESTGVDLGEEFDFIATASITPRLSVLAKYADYDGTGAPADTTRAWFGLEFKL